MESHIVIVFLVIYAIYTLDRVAGSKTDAAAHPTRTTFIERHRQFLGGLALLSYAAALIIASRHSRLAGLSTLVPLVAVVVYGLPWLPPRLAKRFGVSRIKDVTVLKNVFVGATLAWTFVVVPNLCMASPWGPLWTWACVLVVVRQSLNSIVFDVRDVDGDRESGVRTLPVVLGVPRTLTVLTVVNVVAEISLAAWALQMGRAGLLVPLTFGFVYAAAYIRAARSSRDLNFLCDVVADGEWLPMALLVALKNGLTHP